MRKPLLKTIFKNLRFTPALLAIMLCLVSGMSWGQTYKRINTVGDLVAGDKYIFTSSYNDGSTNILGYQKSSNRDAAPTATISSGVISALTIATVNTNQTNAYEITLGGSTGAWTLNDTYNGYLYASSSSSNDLKTRAANSDANSQWAITFSNNIASIIAQGTNSRKYMQYNSTNTLFACYSSASQSSIYLFRRAYTITYSGNGNTGGTVPTDNNNYFSTASVTVLGNTGSLTKTGFNFNGWNTAADGSGTHYNPSATFTMPANTTLYAEWAAAPIHTVTFNANGGTGSMSPQTSASPANLTANTFTNSGYTFSGWNTAADGSGTAYADGALYSFSADMTLYAQWAAAPIHTVTFHSNGGTGTMPAQTSAGPANLNANTFTHTGYTFSGWNTIANGSGTAYADGALYSFSADMALYAQWAPAIGTSTITAGPGPIPGTISSLVNTSGAASMNFDFTITDDGATNDANPTLINQIIINKGTNNWVTDWTQAIAGAELSDGTNTASGTINAANITFASLPNSSGDIGYIADNVSKTYSLKIWLKSSLGGSLPTLIDGKQVEFLVQTSGITTENTGSSAIASGQSVASGISKNVISVVATKLDFVQNTTSPTGINVAMSPAPTVSSNDANGNRDLDFTANIDMTSSGTLSGSPVSVAAVTGLATFSTLTHTVAGTGLQLTASSTGLTNATSNLFNITVSSNATDYFRSKATGDWASVGTWESSADNITWINATLVPNANANTITIKNGHIVTVAATAGGDQLLVESGATLTLNADFTIANGTGDDLVVNGLLINTAGTFTISSGANALFNSGSTYRHNRNGSNIITATWDPASTVEITGISSTQPTNASLVQTFGNFTWNCPGQTGNIGLGTPTGMSIAGNLTVTNTGGTANRAFRFTSNTAFSISVGGKLILNGGHLGLSSGSGATTMTVAGNVEVSNSSELYLSQGGSANSTLNIGGDLSITNATITESGSSTGNLIVFNKNGIQNFSAVSATLSNDLNYSVSSASTLVLNNDLPIEASRALTINGTVDAGTSLLTGAGNVVINGTLISGHSNGIAGTLANTGTKTFGSSSVIKFNAVGAQVFTARTDYANVVIDGSGDKSLNGNTILSGNLTLTNGKVIVGAHNITVGGSVVGGSASNYLVTNGTGHLTLTNITTTPKTFPVGDGAYNPVIINNGSGRDWSVSAKDGLPTPDAGFNNTKAVAVVWDITPSVNPPGAGADITFQFDEVDQVGGSFVKNTPVQAWHNVGGNWMMSGAPVSLDLSTANAAKAAFTGLTKFSRYAISNIDGPLPVFFTNVKAAQVAGGVRVDWSNLTETDMNNYVVERSADGRIFTAISVVNNVQNTGARANYSFIDRTPFGGVNFYRIKGVENSGSNKYSVTVKVDLRSSGAVDLVLYPVPVTGGTFTYQAANLPKGNYSLKVFDATGREVLAKTLTHSGGTVSEALNLPATGKGMYSLLLSNEDMNQPIRLIKTFIVQ
ncbi:MAG: InlB B-repeat-containing protein [Bacteroidetes bacterium]|nr:InlB B-repeat-containing protein [Bacteroidota bacterium]